MYTLSRDDILGILLHNRLFAGLLPGDMHKLLEHCEQHTVAPGEAFYQQGTPSTKGFFLLTGRVELKTQTIPGQAQAHQIYTAGNPFGIEGFVKTWNRHETCIAIETTEALSLTGPNLLSLLEDSDPAAFRIADNIMEHFVESVREANRNLHDLYVRPDRTLSLLRKLQKD